MARRPVRGLRLGPGGEPTVASCLLFILGGLASKMLKMPGGPFPPGRGQRGALSDDGEESHGEVAWW